MAMREARVSLAAIRHNVQTIRAAVDTPVMVIVKADAYGHGAIPSARAAIEAGAGWLGVVDLDEAAALRSAGITAPVLSWLHDLDADFAGAIELGIDLGVSSLDQLERVAAANGTAQVHLKIDTGLGRNGVAARDWPAVVARAAELERRGAVRIRGIFSHLANAGAETDLAQLAAFTTAVDEAEAAGLSPEVRHLAATEGALGMPDARFDLVRIGIGAYGLPPYPGATSASLGLRPAMELGARIASVKRVPAGTGVSYGHHYVTERESTLALVPLGYADGVPRHASSLGPVRIGDATYRVAGRIAMDQFVVDVGDAPVSVGDRAVLFGDPATGVPSADDWAIAAGTINYEIVTRIGPRVTRVHSA